MKYIRILLIVLFILLICIPFYTVIQNTSGFDHVFAYNQNPVIFTNTLFRLLGLIGITLLSVQLTIGANMRHVSRILGPKTFAIHRALGITAYCLILLHPIFFSLFNALSNSITYAIQIITIPPEITTRDWYIFIGKVALTLLSIAVCAAIFRRRSWIAPYWRKLHVLNYIVFALVIIHSWLIGEDARTLPFILLYPLFITILFIALISTIRQKLALRHSQTS